MNGRHQCARVEQAVGWALHALEPGDEDALAEHLPTCPVCREAVRETDDLIWTMAAGDEQLDPPPGLRESLMATVAATPQLPVEEWRQHWPALPPTPPKQPRWSAEAASLMWNPPRPTIGTPDADAEAAAARRRSHRSGRIAVMAATALIAFLGVAGLAFRGVTGPEAQQLEQARARVTEQVLAEVAQPGSRHVMLNAPNGQPVAGVLLSSGQPQVASVGLESNDVRRNIYVLWGVRDDGRPVAVGTFDMVTGDHALHPVGSPLGNAPSFDRYAISIEAGRNAPETPGLVLASGLVAS
jgi:hypothetical protein